MGLHVVECEGYRLVKVSGFLDHKTADSAEVRRFLSMPEYEIHAHHIFDLSAVEYINSAMLGEFVRFLAACQERNKLVALVNPSESVSGVLELTGLVRVMPALENEAAAVEYLDSKVRRKINLEDIDFDRLSSEIEEFIRGGETKPAPGVSLSGGPDE